MQTRTSRVDFEALARQSGLELTAMQLDELHQALGYIEQMAAAVRTPRGREAEPAHIFQAGKGA